MAKLYKIDGTVVDVEPKDKKNGFQLQELYALIECDIIQPVLFTPDKWFICDEEGWLKSNAQRNKKANEYITSLCGYDWNVCGNIIFCNENDFQ